MSLYSVNTLEASPAAEDTLAVLAAALAGRNVPATHRVVAGNDSRSPDEGLAILQAYIAIKDAFVRQAVLDVLIAITDTDAYR